MPTWQKRYINIKRPAKTVNCNAEIWCNKTWRHELYKDCRINTNKKWILSVCKTCRHELEEDSRINTNKKWILSVCKTCRHELDEDCRINTNKKWILLVCKTCRHELDEDCRINTKKKWILLVCKTCRHELDEDCRINTNKKCILLVCLYNWLQCTVHTMSKTCLVYNYADITTAGVHSFPKTLEQPPKFYVSERWQSEFHI